MAALTPTRQRSAAPRRWRTLFAVGLPLLAMVIAVRSFRRELTFYRQQRHAIARPLTGLLADVHDVRFGSNRELRGWLLPSKNGAAVIFLHGTGADRTQLEPEAELLASHGFGVLLYDSPGHGESGGAVRWSAPEREALRAAIDVLTHEPTVDPRKLGVYGFSAGAMVSTQVAASDQRVRALVLSGAFSSTAALTRFQNRRYGSLSELPALWADVWASGSRETLRPVDVISLIAPRPVLMLAGEDDPVVPRDETNALFEAAREPKTLLTVPGAGHGGLLRAQPTLVGRALLDFFNHNLDVQPQTAAAAGD